MANSTFGPRKQRTRQHVIADLSVHFVEGFILEEGHTVQRFGSDYSYDLVMRTFDAAGYVEPGAVYFQFKASESFRVVGSSVVFDVDIRDYNLWIQEDMPVILILFDAAQRKARWIWVQHYFDIDLERRPRKGAKSVRIRIPKRQMVNRSAIEKMRELKRDMSGPDLKVLS